MIRYLSAIDHVLSDPCGRDSLVGDLAAHLMITWKFAKALHRIIGNASIENDKGRNKPKIGNMIYRRIEFRQGGLIRAKNSPQPEPDYAYVTLHVHTIRTVVGSADLARADER